MPVRLQCNRTARLDGVHSCWRWAARGRKGSSTQRQCPAAAPSASTDATRPLWRSHVSKKSSLGFALEEAVEAILRDAGPASAAPTLAIVFLSSMFAQQYDELVPYLKKLVPSLRFIAGSSAYGVIGNVGRSSEEVQGAAQAALSLTLAHLPGVAVSITHVAMNKLPDGDAPPKAWHDLIGIAPPPPPPPPPPAPPATAPAAAPQGAGSEEGAAAAAPASSTPDALGSASSSMPPPFTPGSQHNLNFIMLADPSFIKLDDLLAGLDFAYPTALKLGGLASSSRGRDPRALIIWSAEEEAARGYALTGTAVGAGVVLLALRGPLEMELLIAQGCRPLGPLTWSVSAINSESNRILALTSPGVQGGKTILPVDALKAELEGLAFRDEAALRQTLDHLMVGVTTDIMKSEGYQPEDFLIRGLAVEAATGYLAVAEYVKVGQQLRFMVRDAEGAQQDLNAHGLAYKKRELTATLSGNARPPAIGMLMFSCNGRGTNMFKEPNYDSSTMSGYIPVPCSGFMGNGEIGWVGGSTHLHGFTCAIGVLRHSGGGAAQSSIADDT